jgi:broad specificity phosphatase PhoE
MARLFIVRHGNTFASGETPRRIGARSDPPLTAAGEAQAYALGRHLLRQGTRFDAAFAAPLRRTMATAETILTAMDDGQPIRPLKLLTEIDHGPDEGKTEEAVVERLGPAAIAAWDREGIVPPGWTVEPEARLGGWKAQFDAERDSGRDILMVTSNGAARFALIALKALGGCGGGRESLKLATGAYGVIEVDGDGERIAAWNVRPDGA